ncbi:hypothetical protein GCM10018987_06290 [Streptomyces cremeus]
MKVLLQGLFDDKPGSPWSVRLPLRSFAYWGSFPSSSGRSHPDSSDCTAAGIPDAAASAGRTSARPTAVWRMVRAVVFQLRRGQSAFREDEVPADREAVGGEVVQAGDLGPAGT